MPKHTWIDDLEFEVEQEIDPRTKGPSRGDVVVRPRLKHSAVASDDGKWGIALFVLAVMLTVGIVGAVVWKRNAAAGPYISHNSQWQAPPSVDRRDPPPRYSDYVTQTDFDELRKAQVKIWERTKWNTDIITLMSIVDNHNLAVSRNGYPKSHYIYLNTDWTIDRIPDHVNLSAEDRAFLEKFVKQKTSDESQTQSEG